MYVVMMWLLGLMLYDLQVPNVAITVPVDAGIKVIRNSKMWPVDLLRSQMKRIHFSRPATAVA
jgi:hypothetical protein